MINENECSGSSRLEKLEEFNVHELCYNIGLELDKFNRREGHRLDGKDEKSPFSFEPSDKLVDHIVTALESLDSCVNQLESEKQKYDLLNTEFHQLKKAYSSKCNEIKILEQESNQAEINLSGEIDKVRNENFRLLKTQLKAEENETTEDIPSSDTDHVLLKDDQILTETRKVISLKKKIQDQKSLIAEHVNNIESLENENDSLKSKYEKTLKAVQDSHVKEMTVIRHELMNALAEKNELLAILKADRDEKVDDSDEVGASTIARDADPDSLLPLSSDEIDVAKDIIHVKLFNRVDSCSYENEAEKKENIMNTNNCCCISNGETVYGPLPEEPWDAPWNKEDLIVSENQKMKEDSYIRQLFSRFFTTTYSYNNVD